MSSSPNKDIFISGYGVISAIGANSSDCLSAFRDGKTGIGAMKHLTSHYQNEFLVGEVKFSNIELMKMLGISGDDWSKYTRTALLAMVAAREAFQMAGINAEFHGDTVFISGTTVGGMDKTELCIDDASYTHSDFLLTHACGDSTDKVCDFLHLTGYRTTLSTACSSGANAIIHGAHLIQAGIAKRVIAGGVDALSRFTLNGFNSLMIFDKEQCRTFDKSRAGLNLGEGAGFVVLESAESLAERGVQPICKLSGFANSNDAYHQTASSPNGEGAFLCMTEALEYANLQTSEIDYINVHGTGTDNNDLTESIAMKRVFGENVPPFSSTKSFTGHTLGAAAGIEAVFSVMALQNRALFPHLNFTTPIEETNLSPITKWTEKQDIQNVLSNSFGFGGNCSTLIFSNL